MTKYVYICVSVPAGSALSVCSSTVTSYWPLPMRECLVMVHAPMLTSSWWVDRTFLHRSELRSLAEAGQIAVHGKKHAMCASTPRKRANTRFQFCMHSMKHGLRYSFVAVDGIGLYVVTQACALGKYAHTCVFVPPGAAP